MKTRRWRRYALAIAVLIVFVVGIWLVSAPHARLNRVIYDKIDVGMTLADAERLVNGSATPCTGGIGTFNIFMSKQDRQSQEGQLLGGVTLPLSLPAIVNGSLPNDNSSLAAKCYSWRAPNRVMVVTVDEQCIITRIDYARLTIPPKNWLARCQYWFESFFEEKD